jgi:RHS repeat-associated protein
MGNRTAKTNQLPSAPSEAYTYDAIYQLTQVVQNGSTTTESYTYDPAGNRLSSQAASPWNYNVSNQLTSIAGSPGTTFTYDNNGNTTSKTDSSGTTSYTWDYENRLASVTLPNSGGTVSFTYDPLGRRARKVFGSTTTVYAYDGENIIEETDAGGTVAARFAMGLNIDEPLAMLRSSATHYYQVDGLGSVTSLSDSAGSLASTYTYDSFGNVLASTGAVGNPFRFTAREFDSDTGLYFYRERYANMSAGRFLSEDPIRFAAGDNFFTYVRNNSVNLIDPLGLCELSPRMKECLEKVFNEPVGGVQYEVKVKKDYGWTATTRKNKIIVFVPCDQFFEDPETVLEEYYHVLRQWNTGRMGRISYGWEWLKKKIGPGDPYRDNKYEKEAKDFAKEHREEFKKCLECGPQQ